MKTTEEMIAVMAAYKKGEKIECKLKNTTGENNWNEIEVPVWNWSSCDYRIKEKPKYRPYHSAEEVLEDMKVHGPMVIQIEDNVYYPIQRIGKEDIYIFGGICDTFKTVINDYTWQDGTPFGKEIK